MPLALPYLPRFTWRGAVVKSAATGGFYSPATDHIHLRPEHAFRGPLEFAATALHELGHWTGQPSRLNRGHTVALLFGGPIAIEELRAKLASAFVASELTDPVFTSPPRS